MVIGIGFFRKLNVGTLAMTAAIILGYMPGSYTKGAILAGYSVSLFITLLGLTLLFGIISTNGVLDLLMRKLINLFGKQIWLAPVLLFVSGWAVSALAGGFAGLAFVVGVTLPVVRATGYDPIMMMIISNAGAQAGRYTQISPDGNIVLNLLSAQGIDGGLFVLTANMTIAMAVIALLAFVYFKGYKVHGKGEIRLEAGNMTWKHWVTLLSFIGMAVAIMAFGKDSGLVGLMIAVLLVLIGVVDEKTAFATIPWNTIMSVEHNHDGYGRGNAHEHSHQVRWNRHPHDAHSRPDDSRNCRRSVLHDGKHNVVVLVHIGSSCADSDSYCRELGGSGWRECYGGRTVELYADRVIERVLQSCVERRRPDTLVSNGR